MRQNCHQSDPFVYTLKVEKLKNVAVPVTTHLNLALRQSKSVCRGGRRQPQYGLPPQFKADKTRL